MVGLVQSEKKEKHHSVVNTYTFELIDEHIVVFLFRISKWLFFIKVCDGINHIICKENSICQNIVFFFSKVWKGKWANQVKQDSPDSLEDVVQEGPKELKEMLVKVFSK